jgi:hypothetical protein
LQTLAQGLEQNGDQAGGDERDQEVATCAKQHAHVADDEDVDAADEGGQGAVDEGAVDNEVYVVEAVLQYGDSGRDRKAEEGHRPDNHPERSFATEKDGQKA